MMTFRCMQRFIVCAVGCRRRNYLDANVIQIIFNQSDGDVDVGRVIGVYLKAIMHLMRTPLVCMNKKWGQLKGVMII